MSKYLIEFTRFGASVVVEYNEEEQLIYLKANYGTMDPKTALYFLKRIPGQKADIDAYAKLINTKVSPIAFDTEFATFWSEYANKFGNKGRSEKLWSGLSEEERIKAIKYIQSYNQWLLMNAGVQKKLPETYLNQQPWNN